MAENYLQQLELVRAAVRAHGLHKQLAAELGLDDSTLSKLLEIQVPRILALLAALDLEIIPVGHVGDLRRVLKAVL